MKVVCGFYLRNIKVQMPKQSQQPDILLKPAIKIKSTQIATLTIIFFFVQFSLEWSNEIIVLETCGNKKACATTIPHLTFGRCLQFRNEKIPRRLFFPRPGFQLWISSPHHACKETLYKLQLMKVVCGFYLNNNKVQMPKRSWQPDILLKPAIKIKSRRIATLTRIFFFVQVSLEWSNETKVLEMCGNQKACPATIPPLTFERWL
jgi:hypothetical protein